MDDLAVQPFAVINATNAHQLVEIVQFKHRWITELAWSPDGRQLAIASAVNLVLYTFSGTKIGVQHFSGHSEPIRSLDFAPAGRWLASGSDDGTIRLWALATESPEANLVLKAGAPVQRVRYSADGQHIAGVVGATVMVWEAQGDYALRLEVRGHEGDVTTVAFAPDSRLMATAGWDTRVRLWEAASGALCATLEGHTDRVNSLAFSPDGTELASAGRDGKIILWKLPAARPYAVLMGHEARPVDSVNFSRDGALLVTGGRDHTAKIWEITSQAVVATVVGHRKPILTAALRPDGTLLATGSGDNSVRLWAIRSAST